MPYGGMQYRIHGAKFNCYYYCPTEEKFQLAYRFGFLVGGHLNESYSLSGEFGVATWNRDIYDNEYHERLGQFDFNVVALRDVRWSWGGLIVGPRLGWSLLRGDDLFHSSGPLAGARIGLLAAPAGWISLGVLLDITYLRSLDTNNVLGSITAAVLF